MGEYHAYLPCLIRHIGRGQGQQPYSKITVIGRKICIIPAHRTDSKKAIRKMAIETEKLCNLKHLFLREVFCKCKDTQKSNKRFTINEIYCPSEWKNRWAVKRAFAICLVKITVQKINSRKPGLFLNGIFLKKRQTGDGMIWQESCNRKNVLPNFREQPLEFKKQVVEIVRENPAKAINCWVFARFSPKEKYLTVQIYVFYWL